MREIELKAHVENALELKTKIESLYGEGRDVSKSDVYFHLPGELKQALRRLLENAELCRQLGENARQKAEREFSIDKSIEQLVEIYRGLLL